MSPTVVQSSATGPNFCAVMSYLHMQPEMICVDLYLDCLSMVREPWRLRLMN
ncbi:uncharacterized protein RAG0_09037 [Rhynchosporium agropyri]|uniref:Uncharacterized protein n=1 Tax=Rhynchosporium agropyri TaxID=914238 RepID=A0A1E1KTG6_9HELO|nr:uncharacterized protein RAG0_09037 [Rhynchosporium agropyri]